MHQALYRKWRPTVFDDVYGQEHITSILKYETENSKFSHAYLFCGSRGTGKTTCAKILAKAVNCLSPVNGSPCNKCAACQAIDSGATTDILEMDAASNNGVDNVRDIRDEVVYTPTSLKYRVYIVDEVHMLTGSAFNALLKTLEEPPSHVIFILATTEMHKLPSTIISRCQCFDFRRISTDTLIKRLSYIAEHEGIEADPAGLRVIAKLAQGGMRDAISLMELCASSHAKITEELVHTTVGSGSTENIIRTVDAIASSDYDTIFSVIDEIVASSKDIEVFWEDLISYYRDMLVQKTAKNAEKYLDLTDNESDKLKACAALFTRETLLSHCKLLDESLYVMKTAGSIKRVVAEMALVKMTDRTLDTSVENLLSRISMLEMKLSSGEFVQSSKPKDEKPKSSPVSDVRPKQKIADIPQDTVKMSDNSKGASPKRLKGWSEIVEHCVGSNSYLLSFLMHGRPFYIDGQKIRIVFTNDFDFEMVKNANIISKLVSSINLKLQTSYSESDIVLDVDSSQKDSTNDDLGQLEF